MSLDRNGFVDGIISEIITDIDSVVGNVSVIIIVIV